MHVMDRAYFGEVAAPNAEVAVIESGLLAHGQFLEERIGVLEEDVLSLHERLDEADESESAAETVCPACGTPLHLHIAFSPRKG